MTDWELAGPTLSGADVIFDTTDLAEPDVRAEWLALRRTGIGGSDAAAAMNLSPYATQVSLYLDKVDPAPDRDSEEFEAGRRMEEPIAKWFANKSGMRVAFVPLMLRSKTTPFAIADPDRYVYDPQADEWGLLENKNVFVTKAADWAEGPPLYARVQLQHYFYVTGLRWGYIAALIGGSRFVYFRVERDDELIADMLAAEEKFWTVVQLERMPDVDGSDITREALREHYAKAEPHVVEVGRKFMDLLALRAAHKTAMAIENERLSAVENEMLVLMGGADHATYEGDVVATWKSVDKKEYTVKATSYRQWGFPKRPKDKP